MANWRPSITAHFLGRQVSREARRRLGDLPSTDVVGVPPSQQGRTGGRANGRGVETVVGNLG